MKKRLLTVQGPLQFLAGYVAFTWVSDSSLEPTEDTLLMYDFLCHTDVEKKIYQTILSLSKIREWKRIIHINSFKMSSLMKKKYSFAVADIKQYIAEQSFDEIFLARDHIGDGSELILNAYSDSKKYTYGDAFGLVGQKDSARELYPLSLYGKARSIVRNFLLGGPKKIEFDCAVLSLPIDFSGVYLESIPLAVPARSHLIKLVKNFFAVLNELESYIQELKLFLAQDIGKLYMLSNLSGSGLCTVDAEIALYLEIIYENSQIGETLFIKPHPRSGFEVLNELERKLQGDYRLIVLNDERFARIPIELWVDLLECCSVVAIFSTSSISLKYIYDIDIYTPLSAERISRFIYPPCVNHVVFVNNFINQAMININAWDGSSALWSCPS